MIVKEWQVAIPVNSNGNSVFEFSRPTAVEITSGSVDGSLRIEIVW